MSDITKVYPEIDLRWLALIAGGHNAFQLLWAGVELELFTLLSQEPGLSLEQLSEKLREVVVMKVWGGLTFAQIAEVLKVSHNTAASRYRYALEQLAKKLSYLEEARNG